MLFLDNSTSDFSDLTVVCRCVETEFANRVLEPYGVNAQVGTNAVAMVVSQIICF